LMCWCVLTVCFSGYWIFLSFDIFQQLCNLYCVGCF
jgi:hypothetical protein